MKNGILRCALCFLVFVACDNDDADDSHLEGAKLVGVTVAQAYNSVSYLNQIMIHDASGVLLASRSFRANEQFILESEKPFTGNTIGITLLRIEDNTGQYTYALESYLDIEVGKDLVLKPEPQFAPPQSQGQFDIRIDGIDEPDQYTLSSNDQFAYWSNHGGSSLTLTGLVAGTPNEFIVQLTDDNGNLKHKILSNVKPNDLYSFGVGQLSNFDTNVEFKFPSSDNVDLLVIAHKSGEGFWDLGIRINEHYKDHVHTSIKAGYLKSLSNYETFMTVHYADFEYYYSSVGSIPEGNIRWPAKSAFTVSKKNIDDFFASATVPFVWRTSTWHSEIPENQSDPLVTWNVASSSGEQHFMELPADLLAQHPLLAFDNLQYASTRYFTESEAYSIYMDKVLISERGPHKPLIGINIPD